MITKTAPNILITGSPGTGKTTLSGLVAEHNNLVHLNVSEIAVENNFFDGYDEERGCPILHEDNLLDELENEIVEGGKIVDYHSCDFFPERFFDIIFVLRTDNTVLYDRLAARGYTGKKLSDNMECEILNVILDEARDNYEEDLVHELPSNNIDDTESNLSRITDWLKNWKIDNRVF